LLLGAALEQAEELRWVVTEIGTGLRGEVP
jgi:hypothetical protein